MIRYFYHFHNIKTGDNLRIAGVDEHIRHINTYTMNIDNGYYRIIIDTNLKTLNSFMKEYRINIVLTWY